MEIILLATVPTDFTPVRMQEKWKKFVVPGFSSLQWKKSDNSGVLFCKWWQNV